MNDVADKAREAAMQIEVKKDGLSQLQSGEWTLKLKLHATEIPTQLLKAPMGTRYQLVMVEIGDDEEPVAEEKPHCYAKQISTLCQKPSFRMFCIEQMGADDTTEYESIVSFIRMHCDVESRKEIVEGTTAAILWRRLVADYENWLRS